MKEKNASLEEFIGSESEKYYEVTERDIKRFAQAIDDPDLLYSDSEYAGNTEHGGIIAPALFCQTMAYDDIPVDQLKRDGSPKEIDAPLPTERVLGGGSKFIIGESVRPGDRIKVRKKVIDVYQKKGKSGLLYFVVIENLWTNQLGEMVAQETATYIHR